MEALGSLGVEGDVELVLPAKVVARLGERVVSLLGPGVTLGASPRGASIGLVGCPADDGWRGLGELSAG